VIFPPLEFPDYGHISHGWGPPFPPPTFKRPSFSWGPQGSQSFVSTSGWGGSTISSSSGQSFLLPLALRQTIMVAFVTAGDPPFPHQLLTYLLILRGLKEAKALVADQPYPLLLGRVNLPRRKGYG
jgi:hypothetical protein